MADRSGPLSEIAVFWTVIGNCATSVLPTIRELLVNASMRKPASSSTVFWAGSPIMPIADQREARYTFSLLPLGNVLVFPDFAHRRLALLPFALLNWSISAPVPVGVLNL